MPSQSLCEALKNWISRARFTGFRPERRIGIPAHGAQEVATVQTQLATIKSPTVKPGMISGLSGTHSRFPGQASGTNQVALHCGGAVRSAAPVRTAERQPIRWSGRHVPEPLAMGVVTRLALGPTAHHALRKASGRAT